MLEVPKVLDLDSKGNGKIYNYSIFFQTYERLKQFFNLLNLSFLYKDNKVICKFLVNFDIKPFHELDLNIVKSLKVVDNRNEVFLKNIENILLEPDNIKVETIVHNKKRDPESDISYLFEIDFSHSYTFEKDGDSEYIILKGDVLNATRIY